jgi:hypothetical protein
MVISSDLCSWWQCNNNNKPHICVFTTFISTPFCKHYTKNNNNCKWWWKWSKEKSWKKLRGLALCAWDHRRNFFSRGIRSNPHKFKSFFSLIWCQRFNMMTFCKIQMLQASISVDLISIASTEKQKWLYTMKWKGWKFL